MTFAPKGDAREFEPVELPTRRGCPFDPPAEAGLLRESQPLTRVRFPDGHIGWLVTGHEYARALLGDPRLSVFPGGPPTMHPARQAAVLYDAIQYETSFPGDVRGVIERYRQEDRLADAFRDPEVLRTLHERPLNKLSFFFTDAEEHTRLRRILTPFFSVKRAAEHRARIEEIVESRLDVMESLGKPVDLVETFAQAIPSLMTCTLFGMPDTERGTFERLASVKHDSSTTVDDLVDADAEFREFTAELIGRKKGNPGDDMLSALIHGGQMTDDELVATAMGLVRAAHATTAHALASAVLTLLHDRKRWDALRAEAVPVRQIVEELLRYNTIDQAPDVRTALEDIEIDGTTIRAFENVVFFLPSVNRDPQVFAEPDEVDLTRQASKHLAFGYGIHQCLGQHVARLELEVALTGLVRRFPTLDLAVPFEDIHWYGADRQLYGPLRIPVTW